MERHNEKVQDLDTVIKAMKCSSTEGGAPDKDCENCPYVVYDEVDDKIPCPPDMERDGVKYWQSCDCDRISRDALVFLRWLKVNLKADRELEESEGLTPKQVYLEGYTDAVKDLENEGQRVIKLLEDEFVKQNNPDSKFVESIVLKRDFIEKVKVREDES